MAIGNQLDLNIVVNGFNQAQSALDRLSGVFGNLGQNAINVTSTFRNLEQSLESSREDIRSVANTTNQATKSISDFGESLTAVEGGGNRAGESIRDIAKIVQQKRPGSEHLCSHPGPFPPPCYGCLQRILLQNP